jgi:hypothetical protein
MDSLDIKGMQKVINDERRIDVRYGFLSTAIALSEK